jgi:hypothetical protein
MNPLSGPRQQQQKQQQKQKTLRIKKQGNTLEFHSRLIEASEVRLSFLRGTASRPGGPPAKRQPSPEGLGRNPHHDSTRPGVPWERHRRGTHMFLNRSPWKLRPPLCDPESL